MSVYRFNIGALTVKVVAVRADILSAKVLVHRSIRVDL